MIFRYFFFHICAEITKLNKKICVTIAELVHTACACFKVHKTHRPAPAYCRYTGLFPVMCKASHEKPGHDDLEAPLKVGHRKILNLIAIRPTEMERNLAGTFETTIKTKSQDQ